MTVPLEKARLREQARRTRRALSQDFPDAARSMVPNLVAHLNNLTFEGAVGGYCALRDELDPMPILVGLAALHLRLALPVVDEDAAPLSFHEWTPGDPLQRGAFGVMEPLRTAPRLRPSVLLVPMLAFDLEGYRLGYGGGYYDRTIAALEREAPVYKIGLAFSGQQVAHVPREAHDEPLDLIATEKALVEPVRPYNATDKGQ